MGIEVSEEAVKRGNVGQEEDSLAMGAKPQDSQHWGNKLSIFANVLEQCCKQDRCELKSISMC